MGAPPPGSAAEARRTLPDYTRRRILNAILYLTRNGCAWRCLPHDLPPWRHGPWCNGCGWCSWSSALSSASSSCPNAGPWNACLVGWIALDDWQIHMNALRKVIKPSCMSR
ncbi:transposase [Planctomicrobium sp. SH664]|uniref:transposase n=1 Tax=Planctomicrobium sp. SH664 TaxID=3448125 RepID=UPI003F5B4A59